MKMRRWLQNYISNGSNELSQGQGQGQRQPREYNYNPDYESRRLSSLNGRQSREPSETFVSSKYDFQSGDWNSLNRIFISSLNMTVAQAISALKKSWKMYRHNLSEGEPTDQYAKRLLKLQSALGLEQSDFLKEELISVGYTDSELEEDLELAAEDDQNSGLTAAEIQLHQQLRREEKQEQDWADEDDEWPDVWADGDSEMTDLVGRNEIFRQLQRWI